MALRSLLLAGAALLAAGGTPPADAAELRPFVALADQVVRLSDLFENAGPQAARVLGPGPAPGARIVVEAAQLHAIARQFGVDWSPASAADRAVLERPGRPLTRDEVLPALRAALATSGIGRDVEIELPAWVPPTVPADAPAQAEIGAVDVDPASGRFTAALSVTAPAMEPLRARLSGRVQEMTELPVATRRILPGEVIREGDLRLARVRAPRLAGEPVRAAAQALGMAVRHAAMPGQPLLTAELIRPLLVPRGGAVTVVLDQPGLSLSGQGQALDAGGMGERIRVLNPASRAVMEAEVVGEGRVRVAPGSQPVAPAGAGGGFGVASLPARAAVP